jgi:ubiquinone/menaquinone biosynthesis C-methylase UbiE
MVTRSQTRANYDRLSRWYDLFAGPSERKYCELGLDKLDVRPGTRVLEIGSGTGHASLALARSTGASGLAVGVDLSMGMCRVARGRLTQSGLSSSHAAIICGDAIGLPFRSDVFDIVFMSFTLELFDAADMASVLEECWRVLRDDGRLGVVALSESGQPNLMQRLYVWAHRHFPAWIDCRPIPVTDILAEHNFRIDDVICGSMWGLPVEVVVASKGISTV